MLNAGTAPKRAAPPDSGEAASILVVDDNEMNRDMLARRLRRQGHTSAMASNGREALELLLEQPFDLILLDIMMPEVDGYETLRRLKADERLQHIPVIMISAVDDMDSVVRCIEMGAEDHLPKPFNPMLLHARISASLAKKRLRDREQLYAQSLEREMEIGRAIQASFLPPELPRLPGWELSVVFRPARRVAGDFYDVFPLPEDSGVALVVADVCGKGVGAALFMAIFRSMIRMAMNQHLSARPRDIEGALLGTVAGINDYIAETHGSTNMFATTFLAAAEPASGRLLYVNAGHDPPAVLGNGGVRTRLEPTGPAVGLFPGLPFGTAELAMESGEKLLAFTDGVSDARAEDGASFGEERLMAIAERSAGGASELLAAIDAELVAHIGGAESFDDVTLLAVQRLAG